MTKEVINLLWTGGWDSSFRLLEILVLEKKPVQPIYVFDTDRKSLAFEIRAIKKILDLIYQTFPDLSANLMEPQFFFGNETPGNTDIDRYFEEFRSVCHIGDQYRWLAKFAEKNGVDDLELSVEKDESKYVIGTWMEFIQPYMSGKGHECKLHLQVLKDEKIRLFKYYRFPVAHLTKADMAAIAKENNFYDIIKYAWFCHRPIQGKPCGKCRPCRISKTDGNFTVHKIVPWYITKAFDLPNTIKEGST